MAATQFQINFGDHNPNIHKPGFLQPTDLRFFLPEGLYFIYLFVHFFLSFFFSFSLPVCFIFHIRFFFFLDSLQYWGVTFLKLEKMIYKEHQKLRGIKEEYAKYRYLQLCRYLRSYGTVTFLVKAIKSKTPFNWFYKDAPLVLGFSRDYVSIMPQKKV